MSVDYSKAVEINSNKTYEMKLVFTICIASLKKENSRIIQ